MKKGYKFKYKYSRTFTPKMKEHLDAIRPKSGHACFGVSVGRPSKQNIIQAYRKENPEATKYRCSKDLNISYPTVSKWWDENG